MAWLLKKNLKDGNFSYYIAYRVKKGNKSIIHTKTTGTDKRKIAKQLLKKFEEDFYSKNLLNRIMVSDFYSIYLNYSDKQKSHKTYLMEKLCLQKVMDYFGDFYMDDFTRGLVDDYTSNRIDEVSPTTVNIELRMLRSIFNYAVKHNYLKENPFSRFKRMRENHSDSLPIFMKIDEVNKFLDTIKQYGDYQFLNYVNFLFRTGARRSEILNVEKNHIDLENRLLMLTKTKTGVPRYVPIDDGLSKIIENMQVKDGKLFSYKPDTVSHKFSKYLKRAGFEGRYSLKSTRKTFASHLVMNGVDLTAVQELLGHQDPNVTRKHYAKLAPEHLQSSVKKLPY